MKTQALYIREQSLFIRWRGWKILGGSNKFVYRYCGGQFLKPLQLRGGQFILKTFGCEKKLKVKKKN
jgi:hypothetical protein